MQIVLNISNQQDWAVLLPLLERLNISFEMPILSQPIVKQRFVKDLAYHQAIIARGGDASYFGDAAEWQREQRQDRDLPFQTEASL
jgi:hypothetical protein